MIARGAASPIDSGQALIRHLGADRSNAGVVILIAPCSVVRCRGLSNFGESEVSRTEGGRCHRRVSGIRRRDAERHTTVPPGCGARIWAVRSRPAANSIENRRQSGTPVVMRSMSTWLRVCFPSPADGASSGSRHLANTWRRTGSRSLPVRHHAVAWPSAAECRR
jgi:hypothetical protein